MNLSRLPGRLASFFLLALLAPLLTAFEPGERLVSGVPFVQGETTNGYGHLSNFDGKLMPWTTMANNLVGVIDVNSTTDAYVFDLEDGSWDLLSRRFGQPGRTADNASGTCCASADGRFVLFASRASDLIEGTGGLNAGFSQVYLFDRESRAVTLVSHLPGQPNHGSAANATAKAISADGQLAIFTSSATDLVAASGTNRESVFLFDRASGEVGMIGYAAGSPAAYADGETFLVGFSEDKRYFAMTTMATNLVAGVTDTNGNRDIYLYDRLDDETTLVTQAPGAAGVATGGWAYDFSADGRYLLLTSKALLASGMTDGNAEFAEDCFLWDRRSHLSRLLSHHFADPNRSGDQGSYCHGFSRDARQIYIGTTATDMIPGFLAGSGSQIYLMDRDGGGGKTLVSHAWSSPSQAANGNNGSVNISSDGRFATYQTSATDLEDGIDDQNEDFDIYRYDRLANQSKLVSRIGSSDVAGSGYPMGDVDLSGSVVFTSQGLLDPLALDENLSSDAYIFDGEKTRLLSATSVEGIRPAGTEVGSWGISNDSRWIFWNDHLYDQRSGNNLRVSHRAGSPETPANGFSIPRGVSSDARYVLLETMADDLVAGITDWNARSDVYRYDRETATSLLISRSIAVARTTATGGSAGLWLAADGKRALLASPGSDLVPGGTGGVQNLYFWNEASPDLARITHLHGSTLLQADGDSYFDAISEDERFVLHRSKAGNLVPSFTDANGGGEPDIYLYDRAGSEAALVSRQEGDGNLGLPGTVGQPWANGDWSFVYFASSTGNPVDTIVYRYSRAAAQVEPILTFADCPQPGTSLDGITPDGRYLLVSTTCSRHPGDLNVFSDAYLYDRVLASFELLSHFPGIPGSALGNVKAAALSQDGTKVLFRAANGPGEQVVVRYDRTTRSYVSVLKDYYAPYNLIPVQSPVASRDASYVVVGTTWPTGAPFDANGTFDAYVVDFGGLFLDGFESGNTSAWTLTVP
jgi:Tol biopolymer transport system component